MKGFESGERVASMGDRRGVMDGEDAVVVVAGEAVEGALLASLGPAVMREGRDPRAGRHPRVCTGLAGLVWDGYRGDELAGVFYGKGTAATSPQASQASSIGTTWDG